MHVVLALLLAGAVVKGPAAVPPPSAPKVRDGSDEFMRAVRSAYPAVAQCGAMDAGAKAVKVSWVVDLDGAVIEAHVDGALRGTAIGDCAEISVLEIAFPPSHEQRRASFTFPLRE